MTDKNTTTQEQLNPIGKPYALHRQGKARLYFTTFRAAVEAMKGEPPYRSVIVYSEPESEDSQ